MTPREPTVPRFTVLLPTHNRADVLPFCIESVLNQSETDFELLIVADGCTDETAAVVGRYDDPRIRFHDLPKAPFFGYANRNFAMRTARGRFVAYAPHDDLLFPDHLAQLGSLLEDSGAALAYSLPVWVSTDGIAVPLSSNLTFADESLRFHTLGNTLPAVVVAHRRDAFDAVGGWPENIPSAADWVLWRRILDGSDGRLAYLPTPTSLHFSAQWRASRDAQFGPLAEALQVADEETWWPSILRHEPKAGGAEQEPFAQALTRGGLDWCDSVRRASAAVLNRLAFDYVSFERPKLKHFQAGMTEAQKQAAALAAQLGARDADFQAMTERLAAQQDAELQAVTARLAAQEHADLQAATERFAAQQHADLQAVTERLAAQQDAELRAMTERLAVQQAEVKNLSASNATLTRERDEADRRWEDRCDRLQQRLVQAEESQRQLLASRSWRLSAPLRWFKTIIAGE